VSLAEITFQPNSEVEMTPDVGKCDSPELRKARPIRNTCSSHAFHAELKTFVSFANKT
jgi:hypothetical protein